MLFMKWYGRYTQGLHMEQTKRVKDMCYGKACGQKASLRVFLKASMT